MLQTSIWATILIPRLILKETRLLSCSNHRSCLLNTTADADESTGNYFKSQTDA